MSISGARASALMLGALVASCNMVPPAFHARASAGPATVPAVARPIGTSGAAIDPAIPAGDFVIDGAISQGGLARVTAPAGTRSVALDGKPLPFAPDGRFLIGFGRDAGPSSTLEARLADGRIVRRALNVAQRRWNVQSLPTLPRGTTPTPEFLRRRGQELARINAARAKPVDSEGWRQKLLWPATGRISGVFGLQRIYAGEPGAPHSGVDVARPTGTPVVAPADGVVILAAEAPFTLEGNLLMIGHGMGLDSAFLHLSRIDVKEGQRVTRGQLVGAIGATGRATGPHLHWSMKWLSERIDPQAAAGPMPGQ